MGLNLAALKPQQITDAGHGTVFILLGKSFEDDTEFDSNRDRPLQRGIAKYLNERFIKIPDVDGSPSLYGVCFNERFNEGEFTGLISFNAFTVFTTEFEYWQAEYPKADPKAVEEVVKHAYEEEMIARIKHIMSLRGKTVGINQEGEKVPFGQSHAKLLTEPAALTASLFGLINVGQRINTTAGGKFGRKVSAAA